MYNLLFNFLQKNRFASSSCLCGSKMLPLFSCKHEQRSHFRFASSCDTHTNCSAASLLPQFCKHSDSADLFHKSLLPHVCSGRKCYRLFVQARTAVTLSTLGYHMRSGHLMPRRSVHVSRIFFVSVISAI